MKNKATDRRVVIVQKGGKGNIEQAIFILKKDVEQGGEDYILEEARKIVDEFVTKNGVKPKKNRTVWLITAIAAAVGVVCAYLCFWR